MILPWGTDAPIYHWPIATGALIAANVAVFVGQVNGVVDLDTWGLAIGAGLHPMQWVSHTFLHLGPLHLIGNMIFLWAFGMIVEGKLGLLPYLALYLAIGGLDGATVQLCLLGLDEPTVMAGASGCIFGLMATCLVWAPKNEITCYIVLRGFLRFFVFTWEAPIYLLSMLYIGMEILEIVFGAAVGLPVLAKVFTHLPGACWGFLLATVLVRANLADCEGWDLYSLIVKRRQLGRAWKRREERLDCQKRDRPKARHVSGNGENGPTPAQRSARAVQKVRELIDLGDFDSAVQAFDKSARTLPDWPSEPDLLALIKAFHAQQAWVPSTPLMQWYVRRFPDRADRVRLKLAQILIRDRQRPAHALRILSEAPEGSLPPDLERIRRQLEQQARGMLEEGVLELEEDY